MDYVALFKEYQIPMDLSRLKAGWVNTPCPYCGGASFHLGFNFLHDYCTCFKCGGHNLRMTLSKLLNVPSNTLTTILESFQTKNKILAKLNEKKPLNKTKIELPNYTLSLAEKNYLLDRRFNPYELIEKYNIQGGGWCNNDWKNRIIIPIYVSSKLVSWVGRTILPNREPRYRFLTNAESVINPKKIFFNLDNCSNNYVILLEGLFDVMRLGNDCICGFGIALTRTQIMYLSERFKKVFILYDNERNAQKRARSIGMQLQGYGLDVFIVNAFSDYSVKDAGELSPYKAKQLKEYLFRAV